MQQLNVGLYAIGKLKMKTIVKTAIIINMETIKWYKVKCSFYKQTLGFKVWQDIIDFMSKNIGFDYIIEGQFTEPFTNVDVYYDSISKSFIKL